MEATTSCENKTLGKLTELFSSPKRTRNETSSSCPITPNKTKNLLKRIGRSVSETGAGKEPEMIDSSQWVNDTKDAIAACSSVRELKQHLFTILDKVNMLESELRLEQTERLILQRELETMKKQKNFPFKSLHGLLSRSSHNSQSSISAAETSPTRKRHQDAFVYLGDSHHRRRSSSEIIVSPKVCSIAEETTKPRRKSTSGFIKVDRVKHTEKRSSSESEMALGETRYNRQTESWRSSNTVGANPLCLTMRKEEGKNESSADANGDANDNPTLEEIRTWARSFDTLMSTARGRRKFREFLRSEYSEENLLFWLACEELHKEMNPNVVEEKARLIYEDYISILSPKEVSLDSTTREVVNKNMTEPSPTTFDEAQQQIYILMHRDSFPRFVNSKMFRNLLEKASQNQ